ncbi:MAG: class I SAM-dependent methyltransferase, partial [Ignavibacteriaceae bacterium]
AQTGLCVTAFDPSIEMINSAKENCKKTNAQIQFFNYSAASIPTDHKQLSAIKSLSQQTPTILK